MTTYSIFFTLRTAMPVQINQTINCYGLWLCIFAFTFAQAVHAGPQVVGHISFVKGSNAAQQPGAAPRILGKDTEIFQGDNIQTSERSFVIIAFADGAKVTVRPDSNFSIDHYDSQSANKTAQLVLHQGAVNTSTGDIAKNNPNNFQIATPTATVKPKSENAEFNVRICDKACEEQGKKQAAADAVRTEQSVVARVVDIKGDVSAKNRSDKNAKERSLSLGAALYNSDTVSSEKNSYALMVFPDGEKITLRAESELEIKKYNYQIKGQKDQILFRLAAGGLRAMTGGIGKNDHSAFAMDTPVATIGIRGTITDTFVNTITGDFIQLTRQGESYVNKNGVITDVPEGFKFFMSVETPNGSVVPIISTDLSGIKEPAPEADKSDPKKVHENKSSSTGDTIVDGKKGSATVENKNGEKTEVKEGRTVTADKNGETTISQKNNANDERSEQVIKTNNDNLFKDDDPNNTQGCTD